MTVYSLNVEHPIKWKIGLPSFVVNLEVPSGITPFPCVPLIFGQRFVFWLEQKTQSGSRHWGV